MRCTGLFRREHWQHRAQGEAQSGARGWVLSILQKGADGRWRIARDANLLSKV